MQKIIFTDLDGTFLNHHDYSFKDSYEALAKIEEDKIPLVFTTSKTKIEVEKLQEKVGVKEPFIIENGAAIFFPKDYMGFDLSFLTEVQDYYIYQLGKSYEQILDFYREYKDEFCMYGFNEMKIKEIMDLTGLSKEEAKMAKDRDFTEPFILKDQSKLTNLKNLASIHNIKVTKGGRFYHLIGDKQDKGKAVKKAISIFKRLYNNEIDSLALGDGENDIPMLKEVKRPIIIQNYKGDYLGFYDENVQKSSYKGARGWNEMILKNI